MTEPQLKRARASLKGLAVGDAFGEQFFMSAEAVQRLLAGRALPAPPWHFTDDTAMALSVVEVLAERQSVDQDHLAALFAARYRLDPARGYGRGGHEILSQMLGGIPWHIATRDAFGGRGSMGNGGAMRAAPIGAYFGDDLEAVVVNARRSAEITHAHPEGQAGAIAVALAAACMAGSMRDPRELFAVVASRTPQSETRVGINAAASLPLDVEVDVAATALGNGSKAISQDTVPFCLWCVARHMGRYEDALWTTVAGLGDRDTTCAIVGGILGADPEVTPPDAWLECLEPFDALALSRAGSR